MFIPKFIIYIIKNEQQVKSREVLSLLERKLRQINLDMLNNLSLFPNRTCYVGMGMMTVAVFGVSDLTLVRDTLRFRIKEILVAAGEVRESRRRRRGSVAGLLVKASVIVVVEEMHW